MPSPDNNKAMKSRPELVYHLIQTTFFAIMAVTTLRFKFLWMPHICVVGAGIFLQPGLVEILVIQTSLTWNEGIENWSPAIQAYILGVQDYLEIQI